MARRIYTVDEDAKEISITVVRRGDLFGPSTVRYWTTNSTAQAGLDYSHTSGTLLFAAGQTNAAFTVKILDDPLVEGDEIVGLRLSDPSPGSQLGEQQNADLIISDNERPGSLLDPDFQAETGPADLINALALQSDGKVIAGGIFGRRGSSNVTDHVIRLLPNGRLDASFRPSDGPNGEVFALAPLSQGKILAGGSFDRVGAVSRAGIARLESDGSVDLGFNPGIGVQGTNSPAVFAFALQRDGKILVAGRFETAAGRAHRSIARLHPNGSLDTSFDPGAGTSASNPAFAGPWISAVALQTDGKIVLGGQFREFNGASRNNLARLNADGSLDLSFAIGTGATGPFSSVESLALQPDGKILLGGDFVDYNGVPRIGLARLHPDGTLDAAFNPGRGAEFLDEDGRLFLGTVTELFVNGDSSIWASGNFNVLNGFLLSGVARMLPDGSIDPGFDPGPGTLFRNALGYLDMASASAMAVQADGKIVVAASFRSANGDQQNGLARLLEANLQTSTVEFNTARSVASEQAGSMEITVVRRGESSQGFTVDYQTEDRRARSGSDYAATSGTLAFAPLEVTKTISVALRADAPIEADEDFQLSLLNPSQGARLGSPARVDLILVDSARPGNLDFGFASVNVPFGRDPVNFFPVTGFDLASGGEIVLAGHFTSINGTERFGVARLSGDGTLDESFVPLQPVPAANHDFHYLAVQKDGKVIGGFQGLDRLNADGTEDALYLPDIGNVFSLQLQPDGKLLVGEEFLDPATGRPRNGVTRLLSDGTLDFNFSFNQGFNDWVMAMALQPDGKIVVGGFFSQIGGVNRNRVARLNADGTHDLSFDPGTGAEGNPAIIFDLAIQPDGKILIAGEFASVNGVARPRIARLEPNGALDLSFNPRGGPNSFIEALALQPNGKVLIGGNFITVDGRERLGLARLFADGRLETDFEPQLGYASVVSVSSILLQPDGKILIGGLFNQVHGLRRTGFARLLGDTRRIELLGAGMDASRRFHFSFASEAGRDYRVEASSDLTNWNAVGTVRASGSSTEFRDLTPEQSFRFYRALLVE